MPWPFKSLQNFSFKTTVPRVQPTQNEQNGDHSSPPNPPPTGVGTSKQHGLTIERPNLCQCGQQAHLFCPYCEYDQHVRTAGSMIMQTTTSSPAIPDSIDYAQMDGSDGPNPSIPYPRPRKLKKMKSDYQHIQYELLDVEAVISARPNSILSSHSSSHSRTPLLNHGQKSKNINYLALPPEKKPPKKLEKKAKRQRAGSMPNHSALYSTFSELSDEPRRTIKVVKSKSFLNVSISCCNSENISSILHRITVQKRSRIWPTTPCNIRKYIHRCSRIVSLDREYFFQSTGTRYSDVRRFVLSSISRLSSIFIITYVIDR